VANAVYGDTTDMNIDKVSNFRKTNFQKSLKISLY